MLRSIRTARLLLRCWHPDDAEGLKHAIDRSLPELQQWVDWAMNEPSPLPALQARLAEMRAKFLAGEDWAFGIFSSDGREVLGGAGLHSRGSADHLEIGYWMRTDCTKKGFATEVTATLCDLAFAHTSVVRVEVHCASDNERSLAVPRRLGFTLARRFRQEIVTSRGTHRETLVWELRRSLARP